LGGLGDPIPYDPYAFSPKSLPQLIKDRFAPRSHPLFPLIVIRVDPARLGLGIGISLDRESEFLELGVRTSFSYVQRELRLLAQFVTHKRLPCHGGDIPPARSIVCDKLRISLISRRRFEFEKRLQRHYRRTQLPLRKFL
jgi:hypothetical protein